MEDNIILTHFPPIRELTQRYKGMKVVDVGGRGVGTPSFVLNNGIRITYNQRLGRYRPPTKPKPDTHRRLHPLPYWRATHVRPTRKGYVPAGKPIYVSAPNVLLAMHRAIQTFGVDESQIELRRV